MPTSTIECGELPPDWSGEQCVLFRRVYGFMMANPAAFLWPGQAPIEGRNWQTISHNAAFCAAELSVHEHLTIVNDDDGAVMAASPQELSA